jgi:hypothetical protein
MKWLLFKARRLFEVFFNKIIYQQIIKLSVFFYETNYFILIILFLLTFIKIESILFKLNLILGIRVLLLIITYMQRTLTKY